MYKQYPMINITNIFVLIESQSFGSLDYSAHQGVIIYTAINQIAEINNYSLIYYIQYSLLLFIYSKLI